LGIWLGLWQGETKTFDFSDHSDACAFAVAHFREVEHDALPVTHGHRLLLAYRLIYSGSGAPPRAPGSLPVAHLLTAIKAWDAATAEGPRTDGKARAPQFLVHLLEHQDQYKSQAAMTLADLEGSKDRAVGQLPSKAVRKGRLVVARGWLRVKERAHREQEDYGYGYGEYEDEDRWVLDPSSYKLVDVGDMGGGFEVDEVRGFNKNSHLLADHVAALLPKTKPDEGWEVSEPLSRPCVAYR
jgi:hypothetical protein